MALTFSCTVFGESPYSPSGFTSLKRKGEKDADWEQRIWREKAHADAKGHVHIPGMAFQKAIAGAASFTPRKIEGRGGKQTYAKQIRAGVFVSGPVKLYAEAKGKIIPVERKDLIAETIMCSPTGDGSGLGKRVPKMFPIIFPWHGTLQFDLYNPVVDTMIFETYMKEAGVFIGVGRFRPEVGGYCGRFNIKDIKWAGGWTEEDMLRAQREELEEAA